MIITINMKRLAFLLILFALSLTLAWADTGYQGDFSLNGKMESGTTFRIDAQFWGDGPCLVVGQTTYFRKNGKEAHIKIYGTMDDEHCSLYEYVDNRVCGHFEINNMPSIDDMDSFHQVEGTVIEGFWDNNGTAYAFDHVTLEQYADVEYDFLKHPDWNWDRLSGQYGFRKNTPDGESFADLMMIVNADSVIWRFNYNDAELGTGGEFEKVTKGYGHRPDVHENCFNITVDGVEYAIETMDDVLMITLAGELPEESDDFIDLRGVYPCYGNISSAYRAKQMKKNDPEAVSWAKCILFTPRTDNQRLNDSICSWVASYSGGKVSADYFEVARSAVNAFLDGDDMDSDWDDVEPWQLPNDETEIDFTCYEQKKYINLKCNSSTYYGGVHGTYSSTMETLRRSDGKVMRWKDWFVDPEKVRPIIEEYMLDQNDEVEFDPDNLPLPSDEPYLTPGFLNFSYQQYEVAAYAYGLPSCEIPVSVLLPYMTTAAKNLVK